MLNKKRKETVYETARFYYLSRVRAARRRVANQGQLGPNESMLLPSDKVLIRKAITRSFKSSDKFGSSLLASILIPIAVKIAMKFVERWLDEKLFRAKDINQTLLGDR